MKTQTKEKSRKEGLNEAIKGLKKLKRYELCWEWMEEHKQGSYVYHNDVLNMLIKLIKLINEK